MAFVDRFDIKTRSYFLLSRFQFWFLLSKEMAEHTPLFRDLNADDAEPETTEIESCCMNCYENGKTRLLLTKIPFYKEVVLMSFSCDACGFANNEIQSGGEIEAKGVRITLAIKNINDLNRRVVKSDFTSVKIVEVDFEIPAQSQKGEVTTIEGIIDRAIQGLEQDQPVRRIDHPEAAKQIDDFVDSLKTLKLVESPFNITFEDISGNCFVENPYAPQSDAGCTTTHFVRTKEQDRLLGIYEPEKESVLQPIAEDSWPLEELHGEVLTFPTLCHTCKAPCETNMKVTTIPHFKDVVIMATNCDACGSRTNEVKSGGGIEEQGVKFEISIQSREDMSRDVLKSDNCSLSIPELDCVVGPSALAGRFTTVEGILEAMKDQLSNQGATFRDSEDVATKNRMEDFLSKLDEVVAGKRNVTLILDDPAGNSYVQALTDDGSLDDRLKITKYTRTYEQNDELGINDMKTENYE
ncbi:Zinc finger protein [Pseudolycoriella hygida]|uniref:Zinc finger protein n=1 Tax=Pseudolycoriella hygida TaxID=35572 RepID=A0A9Q0MZ24_9DIPT|nr:Zinc finger protein [Pseudolycoriella hygida]